MLLKFTKMHGLGNDFVVIDAVTQPVTITEAIARTLGDRHFGVGCDQILVVEAPSSPDVDFDYRIFNTDGSEVSQCGNGARCFAKFVRDRRLTGRRSIRVRTAAGVLTLTVDDDNQITVAMGVPIFTPADIPFVADHRAAEYSLEANGRPVTLSALSVGNPHAVIQVDDVRTAPVATLGPALESHSRFPQRVNVGFMAVKNRGEIDLRVYERGAGETLACGSGACAAAVAGINLGLLDNRVQVNLPGGSLAIGWEGGQTQVLMTGPATTVFQGTYPTMTMSEQQALVSTEEQRVADYLRAHPEFFARNLDVLEALQLPHNAGTAVSLVERQQAVLRERNTELRHRLNELMTTSKTNDQLFAKSRALVLRLIAAAGTSDIFAALHGSFGGEFATEHYSLTLVDGDATGPCVHRSSLAELSEQLSAVLDSDTPVCGVLRPQQLSLLFGGDARGIGSAVAIRLTTDRVYGILALGSADPHYYHSSMDTLFLRFIADVLNLVLYPRL